MKLLLTTILLYYSVFGFGQNLDSCGFDNNASLTLCESKFLNDYLKQSRETFDFLEKKIIFVTYPSGNKIGTKSEYFAEIRKWNRENKAYTGLNEENNKIATTLFVLTEKEKIESGGYDAILTYWVKLLTNNRRKKIIQQIKPATNRVDRPAS